MPPRIVTVTSLVCLALVCMATNCGSSSQSSASKPSDVVGNWQFTSSTNSGSVLYLGGIDSQGTSLFFAPGVLGVGVVNPTAFVGDTWALPIITGASPFSGASTLYAATGTQLPSGGTSQTLSSQGTVISDSSVTLTNSSGTFTLTSATPLTGAVKAIKKGQTEERAPDFTEMGTLRCDTCGEEFIVFHDPALVDRAAAVRQADWLEKVLAEEHERDRKHSDRIQLPD